MTPPEKVTLALATSDPPSLVHFIPMSVRTPPKKPMMTALTARALQVCRNAGGRRSREGLYENYIIDYDSALHVLRGEQCFIIHKKMVFFI